mgnify:CR=1 FL=1
MATPRDLLNSAKAEIREVEAADVASQLSHFTLLDVQRDAFQRLHDAVRARYVAQLKQRHAILRGKRR